MVLEQEISEVFFQGLSWFVGKIFCKLAKVYQIISKFVFMFILDAVHRVGERKMEDGPPGQLIMAWWAGKTNQLLVSDN